MPFRGAKADYRGTTACELSLRGLFPPVYESYLPGIPFLMRIPDSHLGKNGALYPAGRGPYGQTIAGGRDGGCIAGG